MSVFVLEDEGASTPGNPLRLRFDNSGDTDVNFEVTDAGVLNIIPDDGQVFIFEDPGVGPAGVQIRVIPTGTAFIGQHVVIIPTVSGQPIGPLNNGGLLGAGVHSNAPLAVRTNDGETVTTARFFHAGASGTRNVLDLEYTQSTPNDEVSRFIRAEDSTAVRAQMWSNGDWENFANQYGGISDESLKQDIRDAPSQWDDLKAMKFRKWKFNSDVDADGDDAKECIGAVGQEMLEVSPGLVKTNTVRKVVTESISEDGKDTVMEAEYFNDGPPILSISYSVLYMKGMVALQEAMRRIEVLEAAIA